MGIQISRYLGFAKERDGDFQASEAGGCLTHRFVPMGRSPYSEPRMFLSTSSVHRGCGAVLGWAGGVLWPVACSCRPEGRAREENLHPMGLTFLGPM